MSITAVPTLVVDVRLLYRVLSPEATSSAVCKNRPIACGKNGTYTEEMQDSYIYIFLSPYVGPYVKPRRVEQAALM